VARRWFADAVTVAPRARAKERRLSALSSSVSLIELSMLAIESTRQEWQESIAVRPRTPRGMLLLEARKRIERAGLPLMTHDEVLHEVRERRGEGT
jgi:hypothetical protein